jgi:hypothetical protein
MAIEQQKYICTSIELIKYRSMACLYRKYDAEYYMDREIYINHVICFNI